MIFIFRITKQKYESILTLRVEKNLNIPKRADLLIFPNFAQWKI